jgi:hypothetical protein
MSDKKFAKDKVNGDKLRIKICDVCGGLAVANKGYRYNDDTKKFESYFIECPKCKGKGYLLI